ncbi:hypothetical protein, partial [Pseudomonas aeruginosa]
HEKHPADRLKQFSFIGKRRWRAETYARLAVFIDDLTARSRHHAHRSLRVLSNAAVPSQQDFSTRPVRTHFPAKE